MAAEVKALSFGRIVVIALVLGQVWPATAADAAPVVVPCEVGERAGPADDPTVRFGRDDERAWLSADRGGFRVRKFTAPGGASVIELTHRNDTVVIQVASGSTGVIRNRRSIVIDSAESFEAAQEVLGGSSALFHARALLSDLEGRSALKAVDMSLLSALAFAASLTGDLGAPLRLTDRFMQRHRGVYRQVRLLGAEEDRTCWSAYSSEVNDAWNDLQDCMEASGDGIMGSLRRLACNAEWLLRSESAWFEYLKCLSPLAAVARLD
ncbi:MAG TPA: hypothetical protein VM364_05795 [Vicinamibacterales bacterium]|nr:hypothetical protein [Vicinamibacterales bacterium]